MNPQDLSRFLDELGKRIGPYGQHAWELLVRQQQIESAVWIVASLVCLLGLTIVYTVIWRATAKVYDGGFYRVMSGIFVVIAIGMFGFTLFYNTIIFLNPEYYAIKVAIGLFAK